MLPGKLLRRDVWMVVGSRGSLSSSFFQIAPDHFSYFCLDRQILFEMRIQAHHVDRDYDAEYNET